MELAPIVTYTPKKEPYLTMSRALIGPLIFRRVSSPPQGLRKHRKGTKTIPPFYVVQLITADKFSFIRQYRLENDVVLSLCGIPITRRELVQTAMGLSYSNKSR